MKPSIEAKLAGLVERHEEIGRLLAEADIIQNQQKFRELSKEYADLQALVSAFTAYQDLSRKPQSRASVIVGNRS